MTSLITSILFVIAANIDNIALGISFGINKVNIPVTRNLFISALMSLITGTFMYLSTYLKLVVNNNLLSFVGSFILTIIGIYYIKEFVATKKKTNVKISVCHNMTIRETLFLTLALSCNNVAGSVAASISGINTLYVMLFTFFASFIFLLLGNKIGKNFVSFFIEKYSNLICALILIFLGIVNFLA